MTSLFKLASRLVLALGVPLAVAVVLLAVAWRGIILLKLHGHENQWWSAPPSLGSIDPLERKEAAEYAGKKYGGKHP